MLAQMNRSALIRVPMYKPGKEKATRIEYRSPDPACNPYLAFFRDAGSRPAGQPQEIQAGRPRQR
jgi:glutamine synthetase